MKKYLHMLILCFFIIACDDCFLSRGSFGEFNVYKKQMVVSVAQGDSIMIDLNRIWGGTTDCLQNEHYFAKTAFAELSNENISVRDIYRHGPIENYLIIKGLKKGVCTIKLFGMGRGESDGCYYEYLAWGQPVTIDVVVGDVTLNDVNALNADLIYEPLSDYDIGSIADYFRVEPSSFSKGDTLILSHQWPRDIIWVTEEDAHILDGFSPDCEAGYWQPELWMVASSDTINIYIRTSVRDSIDENSYNAGERIQFIGSTIDE